MLPLFQLSRSKVNNAGTIFDQEYARSLLKAEPYIGSLWHVLVIFVVMVFTLSSINKVCNQYKLKERSLYFLIYFYHMAIGVPFLYLSKNDLMLADARSYYYKVLAPDVVSAFDVAFEPSTNFIVWLCDICVNKLHLTYAVSTFLFATIGFYGILYFLRLCLFVGADKSLKVYGFYVFPLIMFLPNMHFWTTLLGKDSLIFYAIMAFTFSLTSLKKHWILFLFAGFLFFMVRPHVFMFAGGALLLTWLLFLKANWLFKFSSFTILCILMWQLGAYFVSQKMGIKNLDPELIFKVIDGQQGVYAEKFESGSGINLKGYPLPYKMFTYLFRPLFESLRPNILFVSVENLIILIFCLPIFRWKFYKSVTASSTSFMEKWALMYTIIGVAFMGYMNSNFGISARQKIMFLFCLLIVLIGYYVRQQQAKVNNTNPLLG